MKIFLGVFTVAVSLTGLAVAQVKVNTSDYGVQVQQSGGVVVNSAGVESGTIGPDVQVDGITIINGNLFIDGEKVPHGKTSYTSKMSKKNYRIQWGKNGNISVSEK